MMQLSPPHKMAVQEATACSLRILLDSCNLAPCITLTIQKQKSSVSIDPVMRTCWFRVGSSIAEVDCCRFLRVKETKPFVKWKTAQQCQESHSLPNAPARSGSPDSEDSSNKAPPSGRNR